MTAGKRTEAHARAPADELVSVIEALELPEPEKRFLRSRWLDQVVWMERAAERARRRYYTLRLITVVGAVIIPALVSLNVRGQVAETIGWATFSLSLLVAVSAAVEEFFHFGERWRHYRRTVELLKSEGWRFFQLAGPYADARGDGSARTRAYTDFATRTEEILHSDVERYVTEIARESEPRKDRSRPA